MSNLLKNMIWPAIILGVLIAIVYYRAFLFTPEFNKPVDAVINDASESLEYKIPSHELTDNEKSLYNQLFDNEEAVTENQQTNQMENDYLSSEKTPPDVKQEAEAASDSEDNLNIDDIVLAVKNTVNEALEVFKEENSQESATQPTDKLSVLTESEMLFKARLAYWNRDLKTAESTYIELSEIVEDPNVYGELGNLYYMQSKWKKASEAYYHAAIKLKAINHLDQAYHLLRIIRGLDTETANKLQSELQQSS